MEVLRTTRTVPSSSTLINLSLQVMEFLLRINQASINVPTSKRSSHRNIKGPRRDSRLHSDCEPSGNASRTKRNPDGRNCSRQRAARYCVRHALDAQPQTQLTAIHFFLLRSSVLRSSFSRSLVLRSLASNQKTPTWTSISLPTATIASLGDTSKPSGLTKSFTSQPTSWLCFFRLHLLHQIVSTQPKRKAPYLMHRKPRLAKRRCSKKAL